MRKIIVLLIVFLMSGICFHAVAQMPFFKPTKHKLVKRMTKKQVRNAAKGKSFYVRSHGRIHKNR